MKGPAGLIEYDNGKSDPHHLKEFSLIETKHQVKIFYEKKQANFLVVFHNTLEDWIIRISEGEQIDLEKSFGLENRSKRMHRLMPGKLRNFQSLVTELINRENKAFSFLETN